MADKKPRAKKSKAPSHRGSRDSRGPGKNSGSNGDTLARARKVYRLLSSLYRELHSDQDRLGNSRRARRTSGDPDPHTRPSITVHFIPDDDAGSFARELLAAFRSRDGESHSDVSFIEGRVFCHHCESASCSHAVPPDHLSVFAGYASTGFPLWDDFLDLALHTGDPRIDELFLEEPGIVALCQSRHELNQEQLRIFGKESAIYDVMGQVVTGYLPLPRGRNRGKAAVTFQAVRCSHRGRHGLRLNVVGRLPSGKDLIEHLKIEPDPALDGLVLTARKKIEALNRRKMSRSGKKSLEDVALELHPILNQMARGIERTFRQRRRRTRHAMERQSERPAVGMALKDLGAAQNDRLLFDTVHQTFIVVGPKWRIHAFGQDGRHVTSMILNRENVQKRIDQRRWRYASTEEIAEIRAKACENKK